MKMYPDSSYGFCEDCRQTNIATTIDFPDGNFAIICPACASDVYDDAQLNVIEACVFGGCIRETVSICVKCGDSVCSFHENRDGMCDTCSPLVSGYSRGWSGVGRDY